MHSCRGLICSAISNIIDYHFRKFFNLNNVCVQVNMLLSRLYGESIGFTVFGIFVIDRSTILTVGHYS